MMAWMPGPWKAVALNEHEPDDNWSIDADNGESICVVIMQFPPHSTRDTASLIVCAPELLACLERLIESWSHVDDSTLQQSAADGDLEAIDVHRARAVIAKARGKTP